ncbi:hypothetical protein AB833_01270 [Chromatiales bacterium (ex Bugula neritina AB1)]|nr:hypothetical protein AB833_01270 [Chromatiales bacterium (ex Bugula neritina AB1)]
MRIVSKNLTRAAATAALLIISSNSMATNDGLLGAESVGDLDITLSIPDLVQVSNLDDIDLGEFSGASLSGELGVCIYRNGSGSYGIEFEASSDSGNVDSARGTEGYTLANSSDDVIPYTVDFEDSAAGAYTDTGIAINTPLTSQVGDGTDPTCGGSTNAKVRVNVDEADLSTAPTGNYFGTLYLIVSPE